MKPARPRAPIAVSILIMFVWWIVAHGSGSGWVQAIGDAVFGIMVIGILGPTVLLSRFRVSIQAAPSDGGAGLPVIVAIKASNRARITPVNPNGEPAMAGPDGEAVLRPRKRGVHDYVLVDIATAAPFGLQWWTRRMSVPLPARLYIAPRLGDPLPVPFDQGDGDVGRPVKSQVGELQGVRPYEPGDQRRRAHWPSSAHTGKLMVRELEEPSGQPLTMHIRLPDDPEAAERIAETAMGTAVWLLDRGANLTMATDEAIGPIVKPVASRREAGRRLAKAVPSGSQSRLEVFR